MKEIYVIRHANWNLTEDTLTPKGSSQARDKAGTLPVFAIVYSSPLTRTQQTAELLSGKKPITDDRAGIPKAPSELAGQVAERRKTHPFGVAGALYDIPEARPALQAAGTALTELIKQALSELNDGEAALIVSHDGTMVSAETVMQARSFDEPLDHTYGELEGYIVDDSLAPRKL